MQNLEITRRDFLKLAGISLIAAACEPATHTANEFASQEGPLFMNGGIIEVKSGIDLPQEDSKGILPGTAHPDILISNPIIIIIPQGSRKSTRHIL